MKTNFRRSVSVGVSLMLPLCFAACNFIYDEADVCVVRYQVQFVADMNLNFADVFSQEVTSIALFAFDGDSTLVWSGSEAGSALSSASTPYAMDISHLPPGDYHLVAWGGLEDNDAFSVPHLTPGRSRMSDLTCRLARGSKSDGGVEVCRELAPLYHGMTDISIPADVVTGTFTSCIALTKNTNSINVVLQQQGGSALNPDDFVFVIEAGNGHLAYDNSLIAEDTPVVYTPWWQAGGVAYGDVTESTVMARLSVSRLVVQSDWSRGTRPSLCVYNRTTGATVLSIALLDYALMVRSRYARIASGQEYLDRQDDYNFTFILNNGVWVDQSVVINTWSVSDLSLDLVSD